MFLEILEDYNGVCLENLERIKQKKNRVNLLENVIKIKALRNKQNKQIIKFVSRYLASLSRSVTKTAKISQYTQCLHSLFPQFLDALFYLFEVLFWQIK